MAKREEKDIDTWNTSATLEKSDLVPDRIVPDCLYNYQFPHISPLHLMLVKIRLVGWIFSFLLFRVLQAKMRKMRIFLFHIGSPPPPWTPPQFKGVSIEKGLLFTIKGPRALPKFHTDTTPPSPAPSPSPLSFGRPPAGIFSTPPPLFVGRAGGGVRVEFAERARPLYREERPLFDENPPVYRPLRVFWVHQAPDHQTIDHRSSCRP